MPLKKTGHSCVRLQLVDTHSDRQVMADCCLMRRIIARALRASHIFRPDNTRVL
jgi:hypothetical protein